jgi:hypothetical protein
MSHKGTVTTAILRNLKKPGRQCTVLFLEETGHSADNRGNAAVAILCTRIKRVEYSMQ